MLIGIDGYSASRKTTIADLVGQKNRSVAVVHLDDLLKASTERVKLMRLSKDQSKVFELQWYRYNVLNEIVKQWQVGRKRTYSVRVYDFDKKKYAIRRYDISRRILLIEGIFLYHPRHSISQKFDKRIYLDVDFDKADVRRTHREKKRWGKEYVDEHHPDSFVRPFKQAYRRYYKKYHPDQIADFVIKT